MNYVLLSAATFLVLGVLLWVAMAEVFREIRLAAYQNGFLAGTKATMKAKLGKSPSGQNVYYIDGFYRDPWEEKNESPESETND